MGYTAYDIDGNRIEQKHVTRYGSAADTKLASDLKPGDTQIDLVDAAGWSNLAGPETRALAWYGYASASGQVYADYTYTRNVASDALGLWNAGAVNGNRITLSKPWTGPLVTAGTAVRNTIVGPNGRMFPVLADYQAAPIQAQGTVTGFWQNGLADSNAFPPGTATFRPAAELNQVLQMNGVTQLSYRIATNSLPPVTLDTLSHTRSIVIDVLANDSAASANGTQLLAVSRPKYGFAQLLPATSANHALVSYSTPAYFIGTDRFTYTLQLEDGRTITESVTVDSLGGNLEANPACNKRCHKTPLLLVQRFAIMVLGL